MMNTFKKVIKKIPLTVIIIFSLLLVLLVAYNIIIHAGNRLNITSTGIGGNFEDTGELATQEYGYTMVQTASKPNKQVIGFEIPFTESKVIYSYDGLIKAGMDFADINIDVNKTSKSIRETLPETRILSSEVNYDSLIVYDEHNNPFNSFSFEDMNLSVSELQAASEEKAINGGLLERAKESAKDIITTTIGGLYDLKEYSIEYK